MTEHKSFDDWDMEMSKWRGYVVRALEDSNIELKEIKAAIKCCDDKIDKFNDRLTLLQVKVATISGTVALIVTLVTTLLSKVL